MHGSLGLTRAGGGHNGTRRGGSGLHGRGGSGVHGRGGSGAHGSGGSGAHGSGGSSVHGLGGSGARGGGASLGLGLGVHRGCSGAGGGGPRLSGTGPGLVGRDVLGGLGPALTPALNLVRSNGSGALSGGTDEVLTTSLHDTGEGRAGGKSQKSNGVDHFER